MNSVICFPFIGDSIGGSHISSLELIKELKKKKYNVKIVLHEKGILSKYLKKKNIQYSILNLKKFPTKGSYLFNSLYFILINFLKIRNFIIKNNIKIIHGNDLRVNLAWSISSIYNSKFVWHQRNLLKKRSLIQVVMIVFSNRIISISKTVHMCFSYFLQKKSTIIYNPITKITFSKLKKKKINIAFIGKKSYEKGYDIFLTIAKNFRNNSKLFFNVYGAKYEKLKIKNIRFYKFTNIAKILQKNNILLSTSRKEGFGRTIVEFGFCGKVVIASNIEAHKEIKKFFIKFLIIKNRPEEYIKILKKKKIEKSTIKEKVFYLDKEYHLKKVLKIYKNL